MTRTREASPFKTISDLRAANEAAGMCFFSRETMRFWKSRLESSLIGGRYFITSENEFALDGRTPERIYCVRRANDDATIKTIKSHIRHKDDARDLIRELLRDSAAA